MSKVIFILALLATNFLSRYQQIMYSLKDPKFNCSFSGNYTFLIVSVVLLVIFLYWFRSQIFSYYVFAAAAGLIIGGALFHIQMRAMGFCIADYYEMVGIHFNLADVAITVGVAYSVFHNLRK